MPLNFRISHSYYVGGRHVLNIITKSEKLHPKVNFHIFILNLYIFPLNLSYQPKNLGKNVVKKSAKSASRHNKNRLKIHAAKKKVDLKIIKPKFSTIYRLFFTTRYPKFYSQYTGILLNHFLMKSNYREGVRVKQGKI